MQVIGLAEEKRSELNPFVYSSQWVIANPQPCTLKQVLDCTLLPFEGNVWPVPQVTLNPTQNHNPSAPNP